ncbi:DUF6263 family protein [Halpernia frigidisoli]|uniref:Lipoprotein n=1 Tax=Halpernia frigidisoli TaxID=1125876 RepID=A0A1I3FGX0_9FLAO|nr:DUF6263 family protein [Halpernia frigidisoli]SFI10342.1 hypothetical protein SAMN05443292_1371 [Halpernia frigidisoli]
MKNILAIALISLTLYSCKKETKTITKTDPKTGKTITIEVPVKDSTENSSNSENFAIKDSAGVYRQSFNLEVGKSYPLVTYQRDLQEITDPMGKKVSGTNEATDEMSFTVNDLKNNVYDISINLLSKRNSQSANGKTSVVDTKLAIPEEDQLKMMWTINRALVGNKLNMKMDKSGKVLSITGFDPVYKKVSAATSSMIKDAQARTGFIANFKQNFNEKILKDQFTKNLSIIPAKGAKVGDKWNISENASPDGKMKLVTYYTLKSADNGVATIAVNGGIPLKSDKKVADGVTHTVSSELSQNGTITFDQNSGWIKNQNISVKTTQKEGISDGKKSQSMTSVSTSSVMVNPSDK